MRSRTYTCWDESGTQAQIEATSARAAAEEYADAYDPRDSTYWVTVYVAYEEGTTYPQRDEECKVRIDPTEPDCADGEEHDWQAPFAVVGGIEENPGVWGNGGGVRQRTVCAHCGVYREIDTWAQDPADGEQGLESVEYEDADEDSLEWVAALGAPARLAACEDLDDLLDLLRDRDASRHLDWTDLPTYGGEEPGDTGGVWSWDAERLLVGSCADDVRIVDRDDDDDEEEDA